MEENNQRLLELLADHALFGLTESEAAELENFKNKFPDFKEDDSFEMTAAAITLINLEVADSLPAHLQTKLAARAEEFFADATVTREFIGAGKNRIVELPQNNPARIIEKVAPESRPRWQWFGWAMAAACIVLALGFWLIRSRKEPEIAQNQKTVSTPEIVRTPEAIKSPEIVKSPEITTSPEPTKTAADAGKTPEPAKTPKTITTPETARTPESVKTPAPELTAAQKREQLIASAPDVVRATWTSAKNDKKVSGDVVWSSAQQKGFVRLRDLPVLDASKETYQLWIVDEARNKKTPVSGGIFNVAANGEIIVPITADLRISQPTQFAVTKEKAGGVAVSKPDRVVAVAKV